MAGLWSPAGRIELRRTAYTLLLAAGMTSLMLWMLTERPKLPTLEPAPVAVVGQAGLRALTQGQVLDGFGAWAPDGKQIAFMRDGKIWLMTAQGGSPRALTDGEELWDAVPAWSPDGKQIAFLRIDVTTGTPAVMMLDPATAKLRELFTEEEPVGYLAWAPNGASLYYTTPQALMRFDLASGKRSEVARAPREQEMLAGGLAISPDGRLAIYGSGPQTPKGVAYDLYMLRLGEAGASPDRLTQGGGIMPAFAGSDRQLFYRNPRQETGIYLMNLATHTTQRVLADEPKAMYFHPAVSSDRSHLLVSRLSLEGAGSGQSARPFTSHLYLHTLNGSGRE